MPNQVQIQSLPLAEIEAATACDLPQTAKAGFLCENFWRIRSIVFLQFPLSERARTDVGHGSLHYVPKLRQFINRVTAAKGGELTRDSRIAVFFETAGYLCGEMLHQLKLARMEAAHGPHCSQLEHPKRMSISSDPPISDYRGTAREKVDCNSGYHQHR